MFSFLKKIFGTAQDRKLSRYRKIVKQVNEWEEKFSNLSDEEIKEKTAEFKERLTRGETLDDLLPQAFAVVKSTCKRLCGKEVHVSGYEQKWDMVPYDVQILAGIAMHHGCIAEMMTGEGKTLTAVMPCYLNALTGKSVHLVTVNDYLAKRDCEWVGSIMRWLGLTTGSLTGDTPIDLRKGIYEADIVYGTASEFGFDYLRDNSMVNNKEMQVQRGYYFAIIDEVDSILIDEARTPLIISGPVPQSRQLYDQLQPGCAQLVKRQKELCNRLATEAKHTLEKEAAGKEKEEAMRKLWIVSKGTPHNRILQRLKEDPDIRLALDKVDLYYSSEAGKEDKAETLAELFIIVDERNSEYELTDKGINTWSECTQGREDGEYFTMLDISDEFIKIDEDSSLTAEEKVQRKLSIQEEDAKRKERSHNLRQLLRAYLLMELDVDYMVQDGKVIIVDEHTGRPQPGRRFSDGLHQAIEAKEGVEIQKETQTYATITLQNFFRMYEKISGMTGTAITEAGEFKEIYKLDVLEIPTHRTCIRTDAHDEIYMTEREKYNAILKEVREIHEKGRPILIGTESVEISEKLSRIFTQNKLPHTVLNAKQNEKEAEIVAHAGKKGAITISTNMAGRGTDIKLEPGVASLGGLYVLGTTRHQSRRIDRQLRGRCARQGDPGSSKFYVSFEDSLLRLFASPRLNTIIQKFRPPEGEPISASILNKSIETAQKRVEARNYTIRKHTLEYDDVMNKQRQEIYAFRNEIIQTDNAIPIARELLESVCTIGAEEFLKEQNAEGAWNPEGYREWLMQHFPISFEEGCFDEEGLSLEAIEEIAIEKVLAAFDKKIADQNFKIQKMAELVGQPLPENPAHYAVQDIMLRRIDQLWQHHLLHMDHLRSDVNLRAVGQKDPLTEFKHEAFTLFAELSKNLRTEIGQTLFRFEVVSQQELAVQHQIQKQMRLETGRSFARELEHTNSEEQEEPETPTKPQPIHAAEKVGRNDLCPCGSGKKYKKCCGVQAEDLVT